MPEPAACLDACTVCLSDWTAWLPLILALTYPQIVARLPPGVVAALPRIVGALDVLAGNHGRAANATLIVKPGDEPKDTPK